MTGVYSVMSLYMTGVKCDITEGVYSVVIHDRRVYSVVIHDREVHSCDT